MVAKNNILPTVLDHRKPASVHFGQELRASDNAVHFAGFASHHTAIQRGLAGQHMAQKKPRIIGMGEHLMSVFDHVTIETEQG